MYAEFFGLRELPFRNTPDPRFFYATPDHEEALASMIYTVQERKGFFLLTGEVGAGKTLLSRMMLRHFGTKIAFGNINHSVQDVNDLFESVCAELGIPVEPRCSHAKYVRALHDFLLAKFAQNTPVVLILDEAHTLPTDAFEQLRTIGNLEADDAKLLQIIIVGQPELQQRFASPELRQLGQRLFRSYHLPSMSRSATQGYVELRLSVAGMHDLSVFDDRAYDLIFEHSQGLPRIVNTLCDNALVSAYSENRKRIDGSFLKSVIKHICIVDGRSIVQGTGEQLEQNGPTHQTPTSRPLSRPAMYGDAKPNPMMQLEQRVQELESANGSQAPASQRYTLSGAGRGQYPTGNLSSSSGTGFDIQQTVRRLNSLQQHVEGMVGVSGEARTTQFDLKMLVGQAKALVARAESSCQQLVLREASAERMADTMRGVLREIRRSFAKLKAINSAAANPRRAIRAPRRSETNTKGQSNNTAPSVITPQDTSQYNSILKANSMSKNLALAGTSLTTGFSNGNQTLHSGLVSARASLNDLRDLVENSNSAPRPNTHQNRTGHGMTATDNTAAIHSDATEKLERDVASLVQLVESASTSA